MNITQIVDDEKKQNIARQVLESLPDYFGIEEAREEYIRDSRERIFFSSRYMNSVFRCIFYTFYS